MELVSTKWAPNKAVSRIIRTAYYIGMAFLIAMMLLTVVDVILRFFFNNPVMGTFELIQFMMAVLISFGISYTAVEKGHVGVDIVVSRLRQKPRIIIGCITQLLGLGLFTLITWQAAVQARTLWESGATTSVLLIPVFPFVYLFSFGCAMLCLVLLGNFIDSLLEMAKKWTQSR